MVKTNLQVIKRSRTKPCAGDLFRMALPDQINLFGRVMEADITEPAHAPMPGSYLIQIYAETSSTEDVDVKKLSAKKLLIPPLFINQMPWTKGYFRTIHSGQIGEAELLEQYCFWSAARQIYLDKNGQKLASRVEPCGDWALSSYRWLDDRISDALGIPRAPEK